MKMIFIGFVVGVLLLLSSVVPLSATMVSEKTSRPLTAGDILYVGGSGPNNYTSISDALGHTHNGDTVYVYDDSSPYYETLQILTSISLLGENKETTVIDAQECPDDGADVIHIAADGVTIQGFTIQNSSLDAMLTVPRNFCGIDVESDSNTIRGNIIQDNYFGIQLGGIASSPFVPRITSKGNLIEENIIRNNDLYGILFTNANNNVVTKNEITFNKYGVEISWVKNKNNLLSYNTIMYNEVEGVEINGANNATVCFNTITDNLVGISIEYSTNVQVVENNIYENDQDAYVETNTLNVVRYTLSTSWNENYWGEPKYQPVGISGKCYLATILIITQNFLRLDIKQGFFISFYKFDRHPVKEPYEIS
jgi:parallel beta-helix repeat protein